MKKFVRKAVIGILGAVLLCLPATVFAEPLDTATTGAEVAPLQPPKTSVVPEPEQVPQGVAQTKVVESPNLSRNVVTAGKEVLVSIGPDTIALEPNAPYHVFLDDISLGTFTSDYNGQLFVQVKIPAGTTGTHLLNVHSETTTIQKNIQVNN